MRNLRNPKWLFVINTLPIVVLFFLFFGQYQIIKTLLDETTVQLWKSFGLALGLLSLLNVVYPLYLVIKRQHVSVWYGVSALICYITFIYLYFYHIEKIFPFSVPQWMMSGNIFLYAGTFLMPTLVYALCILVLHFTDEDKKYKAWVNFLIAVGIPLVGYLFTEAILPLWQKADIMFSEHTILIIIIVATLLFLFFLIRGVIIIASRKSEIWKKYHLLWKIPVAIVLPLLGLMVNNGVIFEKLSLGESAVFGDFSNTWFYILAVANGLFVCLPGLENRIYRVLLFFARSITFVFTLYFFLVFLPFLPLSVVAIIAIGTGFLMLTPLLLFVVHLNELSKDYIFLKGMYSKNLIIGVSIVGILVIPAFITGNYLKNKRVLQNTLAYMYAPDYSKTYDIDKQSLQKTLDHIKSHKDHRDNRGGFFGNGIPYLSSYFNWLVMDNLTLSDSRLNTIESVFLGKEYIPVPEDRFRDVNVQISHIATRSVYDKTQNAWRSWVDLEITNHSEGFNVNEYFTMFDLPEGCWISDYYLYVGDKREPGILAEKKAAIWIFSQIRNIRRDPGMLHYVTGNKVAFRVYPFSEGEVRKTGIEFLHKEPLNLRIDNQMVALGNAEETIHEKSGTPNVIYVSSRQKENLKRVKRQPYFHFLVDVSKGQGKRSSDYIKRIEQTLKTNVIPDQNAKISFVNSYVTTRSLDSDWKDTYKDQSFEGGFFLDRAIRTALISAYQAKSYSYPVIVVVTDTIRKAVLNEDFSDLRFTFPESGIFFHLGTDGSLREHSLTEDPMNELPEMKRECRFCETVLEYRFPDNSVDFLPANQEPGILLKDDLFKVSKDEIKEKSWSSALLLHGQRMSQTLHPETSEKGWLEMISSSFISKIMTPATAYLVVENEAQKAMLKKKQEQVLSGNKSLDLSEDAQGMSEPGLLVLAILFGLALWYREWRRRSLKRHA